ncbi:hypothetical protein [Peptoniphilus catoniae]|nr:hypothetical protein [Peptoniphilus catoniae]
MNAIHFIYKNNGSFRLGMKRRYVKIVQRDLVRNHDIASPLKNL